MENKDKHLQSIKSNIEKCGHHLYVVKDTGALPRFCYTIGLTQEIGSELILAGALLYSDEEVKDIIDEIIREIENDINTERVTTSLGVFTLKTVDATWSQNLMLGVFDYYNISTITALQIIPEDKHYATIDIPNLARKYTPTLEPIWKWLTVDWSFPVADTSMAVTDLDALRGAPIIQAIRWEKDYWEIFSKLSSEIIQEETRFVPLGMLLVNDEANEIFSKLAVGEAVSRVDFSHEWELWNVEDLE